MPKTFGGAWNTYLLEDGCRHFMRGYISLINFSTESLIKSFALAKRIKMVSKLTIKKSQDQMYDPDYNFIKEFSTLSLQSASSKSCCARSVKEQGGWFGNWIYTRASSSDCNWDR